jgi:hypothetical protein
VPKKMAQNQMCSLLDHEELSQEIIKQKMICDQILEENTQLKTKVKMLDKEINRKEKSFEDFLHQNQYIQNAQKASGQPGFNLAPIIATAQKYQQETYLVMSLKKQIKELKSDLFKNTEKTEKLKRNAKLGKLEEMEAEIDLYKNELKRLHS